MLQYQSKEGFDPDDYWKPAWQLRRSRNAVHEDLNALNFPFNASSGGSRLAYLVSRAQRALPSFEKCTLDELKALCMTKKISGVDYTSRKKRDCIAHLEYSDDDGASFTTLFDLPAELRVRIYAFYMDSFRAYTAWDIRQRRGKDEMVCALYTAPPPITQVCKILRKETMPMFFDIFRPIIVVNGGIASCKAASPEFGLSIIPPHLVGYVRKMVLRDTVDMIRLPRSERYLTWETNIDFGTAKKPMTIADPRHSHYTFADLPVSDYERTFHAIAKEHLEQH